MNPNLLILLAAGKSSRMGEPKGILRHQDRYWIESQLADFARGGGERAVVVLGHDHQRYFAALPWLEDAVRERTALPSVPRLCLRVAINPEPELGPFSSLQQGICTLRGLLSNIPGPHGAFVLPVDVPAPTPAVWDALARAAAQAPGANAILPRHNGQHGHPVWLSWSFLEKLAELAPTAPDARLDAQIKALPDAARLSVEVSDSRILLNLNTPEDFAKL